MCSRDSLEKPDPSEYQVLNRMARYFHQLLKLAFAGLFPAHFEVHLCGGLKRTWRGKNRGGSALRGFETELVAGFVHF